MKYNLSMCFMRQCNFLDSDSSPLHIKYPFAITYLLCMFSSILRANQISKFLNIRFPSSFLKSNETIIRTQKLILFQTNVQEICSCIKYCISAFSLMVSSWYIKVYRQKSDKKNFYLKWVFVKLKGPNLGIYFSRTIYWSITSNNDLHLELLLIFFGSF